MADDYDRAPEIAYGILQNILGPHIEMIGRLIEDKEVHRFEKKFQHSESRLFSSAQHAHLFIHIVPAEHESTEEIAKFESDVADSHTVDGIEDREFRIEKLGLILGEVSDFDIVTYFQGAGERNLAHDTFHES